MKIKWEKAEMKFESLNQKDSIKLESHYLTWKDKSKLENSIDIKCG